MAQRTASDAQFRPIPGDSWVTPDGRGSDTVLSVTEDEVVYRDLTRYGTSTVWNESLTEWTQRGGTYKPAVSVFSEATPPRGRGRPRSTDPRIHELSVSVTASELAALRAEAQAQGVRLGVILRARLTAPRGEAGA